MLRAAAWLGFALSCSTTLQPIDCSKSAECSGARFCTYAVTHIEGDCGPLPQMCVLETSDTCVRPPSVEFEGCSVSVQFVRGPGACTPGTLTYAKR